MSECLTHAGQLWLWTGGQAGWYFLTIDGEAGAELTATALMRRLETGSRPGWGALRVTARLGQSAWATVVIPGKDGDWLLPVKKAIRTAEGVGEGDRIKVELTY